MADNGEAGNRSPHKRPRDEEEDNNDHGRESIDIEDDDDVGPMPVGDSSKKKRRVLPHEKAYLDRLPSSTRYTKSFMHRDTLSYVTVTPLTDFIITTSVDGVVKFWKKQAVGIEFVKQYRGHLGPVTSVSVSADGSMFVSASSDKTVKIFDVVNFDMFNMMTLSYVPKAVCLIHKRSAMIPLLAISDADSANIYIYNAREDSEPLYTLDKLHSRPVHIITYNQTHDSVLTVDTGGMLEYWSPQPPFSLPPTCTFTYKSQTDLYDFKKAKSIPTSITFSRDGSKFATQSFPDRQIRVFNFRTGKCIRKYDESISVITDAQQSGESMYRLDTMTFGARLAADRELEKTTSATPSANVIFDESGNFIIYATLNGIKIVNIVTNRMVRLLGRDESHRFTNLALYQGAPKKKEITNLVMAASENPLLADAEAIDPILFCTAFRKPRFFMFTIDQEEYSRKWDCADGGFRSKGDRDVYNEKPIRDDRAVAEEMRPTQTGTSAVLHTTLGDIFVKLFPNAAPKAVENFATHAKNGYYDGTIFHRVIPKFMIQGGDPKGDGTGGDSIWGRKFEDEISDLKHTKYTLSMANAGPHTNGSQFFITTEATPWLDGKHTIFGRATAGLDVIHQIELLPRRKNDKPDDPPSIANIDVS